MYFMYYVFFLNKYVYTIRHISVYESPLFNIPFDYTLCKVLIFYGLMMQNNIAPTPNAI